MAFPRETRSDTNGTQHRELLAPILDHKIRVDAPPKTP